MLLFTNSEKGTNFVLDNHNGEVTFATSRDMQTLTKFTKFVGGLEYLVLPDYKTVVKFRNFVKTGVLKGVAMPELRSTLTNEYPEYFI
ncbi:hypothetical protein KAR91_60225 [Candidatus Pacearchaeota archaeon]|nr:hypothetical protein [Candidatus Pacearchaeota archaeon]